MHFTWTTVFVAVQVVSVLALSENENNYLQELVDAGISEETASKLVDVTIKHSNDGSNPDKSGKAIFESIVAETDAVIATANSADQEAYKSYVEAKKNQYEKPDEIETVN